MNVRESTQISQPRGKIDSNKKLELSLNVIIPQQRIVIEQVLVTEWRMV